MIHPVKEKQELTLNFIVVSLSLSLTHSLTHTHTPLLQNMKFNTLEFINFLKLAQSWCPQSNLSNVSFDVLFLEKL
jgi:hypothetical protein